jgi:hypothetical protein
LPATSGLLRTTDIYQTGVQAEKSNNIAHLTLDFRRVWSVHAVLTEEQTMDRAAADDVTKALLVHIHRKLLEAASIAKAAEVCAESGNLQTALKMVMDIEDPTHRANLMLSAALLIGRELGREGLD